MDDDLTGYQFAVPSAQRDEFAAMAEVCRLGRESYFRASAAGFVAGAGTEAKTFGDATIASDWPGGAWPKPGPAEPLHEVGLMLANSAAGRVGELAVLLDAGEVFWSLPGHARGVMEVCARLFRIYTQPFLPHANGAVPPEATKRMYAAAHREIIEAAFSASKLAQLHLALDPANSKRRAEVARTDAEITRLTGAYKPLYDAATTDVSKARKLTLGGVGAQTTTDLVDEMVEWIWPDSTRRPRPLYKVFSGHAHSSLDADIQLYERTVSRDAANFVRKLPEDFVANNVVTALVLFQRTFARLVGFYGWGEKPLHRYSERLAEVFPETFTYS